MIRAMTTAPPAVSLPLAPSVTATIDVASIDTANADRDAHVLSPDLIDVAKRPTMA
jgi:polyisoprenoid-binding protein YceI